VTLRATSRRLADIGALEPVIDLAQPIALVILLDREPRLVLVGVLDLAGLDAELILLADW